MHIKGKRILHWAIMAIICTGQRYILFGQAPASWEKIGPGGGGATYIPTFSYHSPNNFMLRCDMTGAYLTRNGGADYTQVNFANGSHSFAYDAADSNIIYAGGIALHKSIDAGKTWQQIFPAAADVTYTSYHGDHAECTIATTPNSLYKSSYGTINAICVDAVNGFLYCTMGAHFFYSANAGKTWATIALKQNADFIYTNATGLKNEVFIFTQGSTYVFNKTTHQIKERPLPAAMQPAFSFTGGTISVNGKLVLYALHDRSDPLIAGVSKRTDVWSSTDNALSWHTLTDTVITNRHMGQPGYTKIACAAFEAEKAYVVCSLYETKKSNDTTIYWYGTLATINAGQQWKWVWKGGGGSAQYGVKDGVGVANLQDAWTEPAFGGEFIQLADAGVYPHDGNICVITDWYRVMKTMDGGNTWRQIYSIAQADGSYSSSGLDVTTAYGVHTDPFDSNHIAISYTDIGYHHSYNGGKSWKRSVSGVPIAWVNTCYWVVFDPLVKNKLWGAWSGMHDIPRGKMTRNPAWKTNFKGGICVSEDGGKTWAPDTTGIGDDALTTCIVIDTASAPGNRTLYATVYNKGIYKSVDNGKTWQLKNNGIAANTCVFNISIAANGTLFITVAPTPVHAGGKKGMAYYSGAVYRSVNGGDSWQPLAVTAEPFFPVSVTTDAANPNHIYLACWADIDLGDLVGGDITKANGGNTSIPMSGGIFRSVDGGNTWSSIFDKKQYVYAVTVDPFHGGRLYCNTFNGAAYLSDDDGGNWQQIKEYDFHWGHRIIADPIHPDNIYITTYGSGVWHGMPSVQ